MVATNVTIVSIDADGVRTVKADIIGTTTPSTLPTTGAGIDGLMDTDKIAPGSTAIFPDSKAVAIANANGVFKLQ